MPAIHNLTGEIRSTGSAVFCFEGPPDVMVEWSIVEGDGAIFAEIDYTDSHGRASCLYHAEGYSGPLVLQVTYGS